MDLHETDGDKLNEIAKKIKDFYLKEGTFSDHNRTLIKVNCIPVFKIKIINFYFSILVTKALLGQL